MSIENETRQVRTTSLGWMIQRLAGRLDRLMEERLSAHGLTLQQFAVMMTVLEFEGLTQSEIGARFGMPAYAISRAIDHLEGAGLLERRAHPTSRRAHTIHVTEKGRQLGPDLFRIVGDVNAELAAPLSDQQRDKFAELLSAVL